MGLDITFTQRKKTVCPHCGKEITPSSVKDSEDSNGRAWYPFLESIGYYVPYDKRTEENDWYCKDMVLTEEQAKCAYRIAKKNEVYNGRMIAMLISAALLEGDCVVVNANW
jgi:hypothetical protein